MPFRNINNASLDTNGNITYKRRASIASLIIPDEDRLVQACLFPSSIWALTQEGGSTTDPRIRKHDPLLDTRWAITSRSYSKPQ